MFGLQRYDLRFRNMPWMFRDSFTGAAMTDTKETATVKRQLGKDLLVFAGTVTAISLLLAVLL